MAETAQLAIIGLGPGAPEYLTRAALALLRERPVLLRTRQHPVVHSFPEATQWESCDDLYESAATFEQAYDAIVARVLQRAKETPLVYAVPGHPLVGEATVRRLLVDAPSHGISYTVIPGLSFIDAALPLLGIDALASNLQIVDALELVSCAEAAPFAAGYWPLSPLRPALLGQVYDRYIASHVKLVLQRLYPAETPIRLIRAAGSSHAHALHAMLYELDHYDFDATTTVFIPALDPLDAPVTEALQRVVARLRAPNGCPWDREQTHRTLVSHLLEETYETIEAIEAEDDDALREELGDVLLQVLMHAQIAEERGAFVYEEIVGTVIEKLVRRHPHVFGQERAESASSVLARWEAIKAAERAEQGRRERLVPASLPALARTQKLLERLHRIQPERLAELQRALALVDSDPARVLGARIVSLVIEAIRSGVDSEAAVRSWSFALEREVIDQLQDS